MIISNLKAGGIFRTLKANDIRIGNIICFYTDNGCYVIDIVVGIEQCNHLGNIMYKIRFKNNPHERYLYECFGIIFKKEFLLFNGFKYQDSDNRYLLSIGIKTKKKYFPLWIGRGCFWVETIIKPYRNIHFIHELQNLYYCVVKKELELRFNNELITKIVKWNNNDKKSHKRKH